MNQEERKILEDFQGFIQFELDNDKGDTRLTRVLGTLGHDIVGISEKDDCFSPRSSRYAKYKHEPLSQPSEELALLVREKLREEIAEYHAQKGFYPDTVYFPPHYDLESLLRIANTWADGKGFMFEKEDCSRGRVLVSENIMLTHTIKNPWLEDSEYPSEDWRYEVQNNDTRLGYWEWVASKKEQEGDNQDG